MAGLYQPKLILQEAAASRLGYRLSAAASIKATN
jgi:hypothetical protein